MKLGARILNGFVLFHFSIHSASWVCLRCLLWWCGKGDVRLVKGWRN